MATYNGAEYIKEQIDSILVQLSSGDELIISDDGSTDGTLSILETYAAADPRIHVLHHNRGCYTKNFENAIRAAQGDYIFLSDQDDVWLPEKVKQIILCFKQTGADFLVSNAELVDGEKNSFGITAFEKGNTRTGFIHNLLHTSYIGACMAFRREVLNVFLPIPGNPKYIAHDYWLACVSELYYHTELIREPLILYRRHGDNTSPAFGTSNLSVPERVFKRFYTLFFLVGRIGRKKKRKY